MVNAKTATSLKFNFSGLFYSLSKYKIMIIKDVRATINFSLMYGDFSINVSNTHKRRLMFKVSEKKDSGWVNIPTTASEYILKDFKQTETFKKIELIFKNVLDDYGY